ncbi:MAG TPA: O-antigen ligase family protein [Solirubrobacterales bacterium]|nr:O-antigen ligase family protein [Solirubrobacterales bacterium]
MPPATALARAGDLALALAAAALAAAVGLLVAYSPLLAALAVIAVCIAIAVARFGAYAVTMPALALLPWLVLVEGEAPRMVGTFTTAVAAAGLLALSLPLRFESRVVPFAAIAFVIPVLGHAVFATYEDQWIAAAKYLIFPAMALAVCNVNASRTLARLRRPILASCLVALSAHIVVIALGLGKVGTYYDVGERLGFAAEIPHALALLGVVVAGAGLTMPRVGQQVVFFAAGAIPAAMTAVRSALLSFAVMLGVYLWNSAVRGRTIAVLVAIAVVAIVSGAADVVTNRLDEQGAEFATFSSAGSDRGLIWTTAINGWLDSGLGAWIYGAGLRASVEFEIAALASPLVGHSDVIEVLVQLGVIGLIAWLAIWFGLLRAGLSPLILLPMLAFGAVNGSLEYLPSLALGLFLAAACGRRGRAPAGAST